VVASIDVTALMEPARQVLRLTQRCHVMSVHKAQIVIYLDVKVDGNDTIAS
jgi:hypothetical protein